MTLSGHGFPRPQMEKRLAFLRGASRQAAHDLGVRLRSVGEAKVEGDSSLLARGPGCAGAFLLGCSERFSLKMGQSGYLRLRRFGELTA